MNNEILFFIAIVINFTGILIAYKLFGKTGLFSWVAIATVIANIEVTKCVNLFGLSVTLGNVIYGTSFLATDILSEVYTKKQAQKAVWIGFFSLIITTILMQISLQFVPNEFDQVNNALHSIFAVMPRICIASGVAYLISNMFDTISFDFIKKLLPQNKWLWVRNNGSTLTSQAIDTIVFTVSAFWGIYDTKTIIELCLTTYTIKVLISLLDTPFLYIAKNFNKKGSDINGE